MTKVKGAQRRRDAMDQGVSPTLSPPVEVADHMERHGHERGSEKMADFFDVDTEVARTIANIERRVRPTICPTHGMFGTTIEGRISQDDFDTLVNLAREAASEQEGR